MSTISPPQPASFTPPPAPPKAAAKAPEKPAEAKAAEAKPAEAKAVPDSKPGDAPPPARRSLPTLSPADVSYVDSLLGIIPAQAMSHILLKTGIPQAGLGHDLDTTA